MVKFVLVFLLALLWCGSSAQLDCRTLNVERSVSSTISGSGLRVCQTSSGQCCSSQFLNKVDQEFGEELLEGLKGEFSDYISNVANISETLASYFEDAFLDAISSALPVPSVFRSHVSETLVDLANLLNRTKFVINATNPEVNTTAVIVSIFDGVDVLINSIGGSVLNDEKRNCIHNVVSSIDSDAILSLGKDLEQMRRAYTFLDRILNFLKSWTETNRAFIAASIPKMCIRRATEIAFCGRCQKVLPPLCSNTCRALVRGCYAPYVTGLTDQFNQLWNVTGQAVQIMKITATRLVEGTGSLVDSSKIAACIVSSQPAKRDATISNFPTRVESLIPYKRGSFVYSALGPRFCLSEPQEVRYCKGEISEPSNRRCSSDEICTSSCKCWNGQDMQDGDTAAFTGSSVDEQDKNPVLTVPKEESEALIATLGTPVTSFLASDDVMTIIPDNITVYNNKADSITVISMVTLLGLFLIQVFIL